MVQAMRALRPCLSTSHARSGHASVLAAAGVHPPECVMRAALFEVSGVAPPFFRFLKRGAPCRGRQRANVTFSGMRGAGRRNAASLFSACKRPPCGKALFHRNGKKAVCGRGRNEEYVLKKAERGAQNEKSPERYVRALKKYGAEGQNRTAHTGIFSPLLYQLSYLGTTKDFV